jgi:hydrogenase maturation protease
VSAPARWRIIGVGSPSAGDDLGWAAIEVLQGAALEAVAELLTLDRPGPALIEYLDPQARVILIDAMHAGLSPGSVRELALDEVILRSRPPSTHDLGLGESLALALALDRMPLSLHLIGIEAGPGSGVPEWRQPALREVVVRVKSLVGSRP